MLFALLLLQAAAAPALPPAPFPNPSAEAVTLGTRLAEQGTLASLLPMMAARETDELVARHPDLSAAEQAELRRTADATFAAGRTRLMAAEGRAYAGRLSEADLRKLVARGGDPVAARYRAALVPVIATTMASAGEMHFKEDVIAAFCARPRTGKVCAK